MFQVFNFYKFTNFLLRPFFVVKNIWKRSLKKITFFYQHRDSTRFLKPGTAKNNLLKKNNTPKLNSHLYFYM